MEYLGKKIITYFGHEFIADEYAVNIKNEMFEQLLKLSDIDTLNKILDTQIRLENFEAAEMVKNEIDSRFINP